jgi:hypothetical protein
MIDVSPDPSLLIRISMLRRGEGRPDEAICLENTGARHSNLSQELVSGVGLRSWPPGRWQARRREPGSSSPLPVSTVSTAGEQQLGQIGEDDGNRRQQNPPVPIGHWGAWNGNKPKPVPVPSYCRDTCPLTTSTGGTAASTPLSSGASAISGLSRARASTSSI